MHQNNRNKILNIFGSLANYLYNINYQTMWELVKQRYDDFDKHPDINRLKILFCDKYAGTSTKGYSFEKVQVQKGTASENFVEILPNEQINNNSKLLVKGVFDLDIDSEITSVLFKENKWQTNHNNDKLNSFSEESKYLPEIVDFNTLQDFKSIKLFFTHHDHQKLVDLKDQILQNYVDTFSFAFSLPFCLEFMHKSVDKSVAIAKILQLENLVFEETISFGDGFNDEKMLKATGKALIMGNAPQSLRDTLPHLETILSNDEDGVAKYLLEQLL